MWCLSVCVFVTDICGLWTGQPLRGAKRGATALTERLGWLEWHSHRLPTRDVVHQCVLFVHGEWDS
jgi:hypothetical protein